MHITYFRRLSGLAAAAFVMFAALAPNTANFSLLQAHAQDANTISVDGSNIVSPVLKAAAQSYAAKNPNVKVDVNVSGTGGGFEKLCNGSLDINMAVRPITDAEAAACQQKKVNFIEVVIGYDALVLVVNNSSPLVCLTTDQLNKLLGPAASSVKNIKDVDPALGDRPISAIYTTAAESPAYVLADSIVPGDKLRSDITTVDAAATGANPNAAIKVDADMNGIGLLTFSEYQRLQSGALKVKALQLNGGSGCVSAAVPAIEQAQYPGGEVLYLYVNAASLDRKPVPDFLTYLMSGDARAALIGAGFVEASQTTYDRAQNYLTTRQVGRTFSRIQNVNVPADTAGSVATDGSAAVFPILKAIGDAFAPRYANIKLNPMAFGNEAGYKKLCANNIDMIGATRLPTDAEATACQQANVQTLRLQLGANALVLVASVKNIAVTCLTTDEIGKLFGVDATGKVKKWSDVNAKFPGTDLVVITPTDGAPETDLLLTKAVKQVAPLRRTDTTENDDPLWRAAAAQNVEGGITYMSYADFKKNTSNVHVVQVDAGKGCVEPSEANIKNGTYPLTEQLYIVLNLNTFSRPEIKAFAWYLLSDDGLTVISKQGLVGTDLAGITAAREIALARFSQNPLSTAATPGATAQATGQATGAATNAANPAATGAATSAVVSTPAATAQATTQATAQGTAAP